MALDFSSIELPPSGVVLRLPPDFSTKSPAVTGDYVYEQVRRQLKDGAGASEKTMSVQMKSQLRISHAQPAGIR